MANLKKIYHNGTAYNIPVTSVNNSTGDVTVQETLVSGTNIKTINNTSLLGSGNIDIQSGDNYTAGEGIEIGTITKNGRQGPAPDGFHVPSNDEWNGVKTIMDGLSLTTGDGYRINLHIPFAGFRDNTNSDIGYQNSQGYYWTSSPNTAGSSYYKCRLFYSGKDVLARYSTYGYSVRCFKDLFVTPTSSWTVIQGTLGSAGIFWNQTDGIISITSDGTTGYTIMDKNLGATTVYSNGDTLSEANCGKYYQWGNNYGFPRTGSVTTSSTRVNASTYGPGTVNGYYNSDTFITGNNDWSSVTNNDLWGDTTGTYTLDNAITNTGVLSVNGQTGNISNVVTGDGQYVINVSTTAPASGTASNIITIVTD